MKRNPKNGPPQFLLYTSCTTPYEDYSETEFHSFQLRFTSGRPRMDGQIIKRNPNNGPPKFLLLTLCTTPTRIIRKSSSIRFSSDSLPDDPEWTRMQFHKSIGTNYEKKSKKWAASIFASYLVYYPLRELFGNRVLFVSAPIDFRTTPNGREWNFINP